MKVYIIGSLRNPQVPIIANKLQELTGFDVFADWYGAGQHADDAWRDYEKQRGYSYLEALKRPAAVNVYQFDKRHLDEAKAAVLVAPAGKSGHLELGYALGKGKYGAILLDNPERWDVMYQFANLVTDDLSVLADGLINFDKPYEVKGNPYHNHKPIKDPWVGT